MIRFIPTTTREELSYQAFVREDGKRWCSELFPTRHQAEEVIRSWRENGMTGRFTIEMRHFREELIHHDSNPLANSLSTP